MTSLRDEFGTITHHLRSIPEYIPKQELPKERFDQLDLARGIAIALMVLSHTVMGLNTYSHLPSYALVPIHLITKFSSTLFFAVFGVTLALRYLPSCGTEKWGPRRNRLLWRGFTVLLWYKILTVVQMFQTYPKKEIMDRLLFRDFTDFAEVLNFYWPCIIWIALLLPLWNRLPNILRFLWVLGFAVGGVWLNQNYDFGGVWQIKAMLVEYKGTYCFGQLQRGALVLFALFVGGLVFSTKDTREHRSLLGLAFLVLGLLSFTYFIFITEQTKEGSALILKAIAKNFGKHPPNTFFSAFSAGGAFVLIGLCTFIPPSAVKLLHPFKIIGREAFFCFNLHLIIIFIVYRYFLNLRWNVTYLQTLLLFGGVFLLCYALSPVNTYFKKKGTLWKWVLP